MKRSIARLSDAILRFDVLSLDIFDTILLRGHESERSRFAWIAHDASRRLERQGFSRSASVLFRTRNDVAASGYRALRATDPSGDLRLSRIHEIQALALGLPRETTDLFLESELAAERRFLHAQDVLLELLSSARVAGKRIIAVSDTYYSQDELRRLLLDVLGSDPFDAIYASSDWSATKKSGALFARVLGTEDVKPQQMLHCGDDQHADGVMASSAGISTHLLPRRQIVYARRELDAAAWCAAHWAPHWRLA